LKFHNRNDITSIQFFFQKTLVDARKQDFLHPNNEFVQRIDENRIHSLLPLSKQKNPMWNTPLDVENQPSTSIDQNSDEESDYKPESEGNLYDIMTKLLQSYISDPFKILSIAKFI
jgi:hypothetical protein